MTGPGQARALARVSEAAVEVERLQRRATEWAEDRDRRIVAAHRKGISLRRIAEHAGISHTQVAKIVAAATTEGDAR